MDTSQPIPQDAQTPGQHRFNRRSEDIGNIVEFGHINLSVANQQQAIVFYVMGLGLTRDPYLVTGVDNAWINAGTCQFHLPVGKAQVLRGVVGLVMPDLDALTVRLERVRPRLEGTAFSFERHVTQVDVVCPWGNRLRVHAPDQARFGPVILGMPYVEVDVPAGTAAGIARFYADVMASPARVDQDAEGSFTRVPIGFAESLVFRETRRTLAAYDGHHIQIAVADFSGVHRRLLERGLITEESNQSQYRFQDIVDPQSGQLLTTLEHEVRSMRHPMYARSLVNRDAAVTSSVYATGYEAAMWRMPPG
jgi:catechol 2,3-dioxygenase-like lactoylglutathione lyase family enzyme